MTMTPFDSRICKLGEGPLWHPRRNQLFWFDILGKRLLTQGTDPQFWQFDEHVSAAGWIDADHLLIASATGLWRFGLQGGARDKLADLEAGNPLTRSNDGRADPWGGFWIGTMGLNAEPELGAIYRFYRGEVVQLYSGITISNAICFPPDGSAAYFTDTSQAVVWRQPLDAEGWPRGAREVFLDLSHDQLNPDGAVVDSQGGVWIAQWGASRVARYLPNGQFDQAITLPVRQTSCPAFGGADLRDLYVTSAAIGLHGSFEGTTWRVRAPVPGQLEHQIKL